MSEPYRTDPLSERVAELETEQTKQLVWNERVAGKDGSNGRLSRLFDDMSGLRKLIIAVAIAAISALGGAVGAVYAAAKESGAKDARLERVERDVSDLRDEIRSLRIERRWNRLDGD